MVCCWAGRMPNSDDDDDGFIKRFGGPRFMGRQDACVFNAFRSENAVCLLGAPICVCRNCM